MAFNPTTTHYKARRQEFFLVHPSDIKVDENPELRGRRFAPTREQVKALANSMRDPAIGQQNPIVCRRAADKSLVIVSGYTRLEAAKEILKDDPEFRLKVTTTICSEKEAVVKNIAENAVRAETSPIDDAYNHRRLMEAYGMSKAEVMKIYSYTDPKKIARLARLLELPERAQLLVHSRLLTVASASDILDIPTEAGRKAALDEVYAMTETGKKAKAQKIRDIAREAIVDDGDDGEADADSEEEAVEEAAPARKPKKARLMRDVNQLLVEMTKEDCDPKLQQLGETLRQWVDGKKTNRWLLSRCLELMSVEE